MRRSILKLFGFVASLCLVLSLAGGTVSAGETKLTSEQSKPVFAIRPEYLWQSETLYHDGDTYNIVDYIGSPHISGGKVIPVAKHATLIIRALSNMVTRKVGLPSKLLYVAYQSEADKTDSPITFSLESVIASLREQNIYVDDWGSFGETEVDGKTYNPGDEFYVWIYTTNKQGLTSRVKVFFNAKGKQIIPSTDLVRNPVTRTINYLDEDGNTIAPSVIQKGAVTRTIKSTGTGNNISYGDWENGKFDSIRSPKLTGYTTDTTTVPEAIVDDDTTSSTVNVVYRADKITITVNYIDDATGTILKADSIQKQVGTTYDYTDALEASISSFKALGYTMGSTDLPTNQKLVDDNILAYTVHLTKEATSIELVGGGFKFNDISLNNLNVDSTLQNAPAIKISNRGKQGYTLTGQLSALVDSDGHTVEDGSVQLHELSSTQIGTGDYSAPTLINAQLRLTGAPVDIASATAGTSGAGDYQIDLSKATLRVNSVTYAGEYTGVVNYSLNLTPQI